MNDLMSEGSPNPELLRSLGQLARGLSALFWGLLYGAHHLRGDGEAWICCGHWASCLVLAVNALILFGLWQMDDFQKQERPWRKALDRAKIIGIVNLGLSPFLFFYSRKPDQPLFFYSVLVLFFSSLMFLFELNVVLRQLGAMLLDEQAAGGDAPFRDVEPLADHRVAEVLWRRW